MKTYYIETLGCKVNQYESNGISAQLEYKGYKKGEKKKPADIVIINTCSVTSKAGMQSRQAIRRIIRDHPDAKVVVTGCHAQTSPDEIQKIEEMATRGKIVGQADKTRIANHIEPLMMDDDRHTFKKAPFENTIGFSGFKKAVKGEMTRAYLKIQDGCDAFCSYCVVPYARGSCVSMPKDQVFQHLKELNDAGFKEVILTGIHMGMYGQDFKKKLSLFDLLNQINHIQPVHRIRLSSIEPGEVNDGIIQLAKPGNILCDHFHIPLQSGDDDILKMMKRPYSGAAFENLINKIHKIVPSAAIGVDILIGFPSETDAQFEHTYQLIEKLPVTYLHVFPFSARKGTPAYHFKMKVDAKTIKERCNKMRKLGQRKKLAFIESNLGKPLEGLIQHTPDPESGKLRAVTSNYLTVGLDKKQDLQGKIIDLICEQCDSNLNITGRIINA